MKAELLFLKTAPSHAFHERHLHHSLTPASGYALVLTCSFYLENLLYLTLPADSIQGLMLPSYGRPTN